MCHMPCVTFHASCVICHVSCVMCSVDKKKYVKERNQKPLILDTKKVNKFRNKYLSKFLNNSRKVNFAKASTLTHFSLTVVPFDNIIAYTVSHFHKVIALPCLERCCKTFQNIGSHSKNTPPVKIWPLSKLASGYQTLTYIIVKVIGVFLKYFTSVCR